MHGTIEVAKPRKWTERDEYYLRAALERAAYHRDMRDEDGANILVNAQRRDLISRADRSVAALLAQKFAAKESV